MLTHLLIRRASPDWINFNLESSREFLRWAGRPETLIIEFSELWSRHFKVEYRAIRAQLKALAANTNKNIRQCTLLDHHNWDESLSAATNWVAFVDDDDWMSPGLFENLPPPRLNEEGVQWGSLRLGRVFSPNGYDHPIIQRRPLNHVVYTNNYAVTGHALHRFGRLGLFDHRAAQFVFDRPDFVSSRSKEYLSCTVKHPCSTVCVEYLMSCEEFRSNPRLEMEKFLEAIGSARIDEMDAWLREPFARFREVMVNSIRPR